ncbi:MAG: BrnA antitoxin family protein [Lachnospiraceae bacterium]|nr:BrnA antitoxin family protein [Lachnospiraceae bacterium]
MKKEYDIKNLNPRKNPYSKRLKKQITININDDTITYFKSQSEEMGIPYQALINLYLSDCVSNRRKLQLAWS